MKDENLENTVVTLHGQGWPIRKISREIGLSRKRIQRILVSKSVLRDTTPEQGIGSKSKRPSKLDPYKEYIAELLGKYSDITGQRVYELLKEKGFDGKITIVRGYLNSVRVVAESDVSFSVADFTVNNLPVGEQIFFQVNIIMYYY